MFHSGAAALAAAKLYSLKVQIICSKGLFSSLSRDGKENMFGLRKNTRGTNLRCEIFQIKMSVVVVCVWASFKCSKECFRPKTITPHISLREQ